MRMQLMWFFLMPTLASLATKVLLTSEEKVCMTSSIEELYSYSHSALSFLCSLTVFFNAHFQREDFVYAVQMYDSEIQCWWVATGCCWNQTFPYLAELHLFPLTCFCTNGEQACFCKTSCIMSLHWLIDKKVPHHPCWWTASVVAGVFLPAQRN